MKQPPQASWRVGSPGSDSLHHWKTFPAMSSAPMGDAPRGKLPTGDVNGKPSECSRSHAPRSLIHSDPFTPETSKSSRGHEASAKLHRGPGSHSLPHG